MLGYLWQKYFPNQASIKSTSHQDLSLVVSYFGFAKIVGQVGTEKINLNLNLQSKKVLGLQPDRHIVNLYYTMGRITDELDTLRFYFCLGSFRAIRVQFSRSELVSALKK